MTKLELITLGHVLSDVLVKGLPSKQIRSMLELRSQATSVAEKRRELIQQTAELEGVTDPKLIPKNPKVIEVDNDYIKELIEPAARISQETLEAINQNTDLTLHGYAIISLVVE